MSALMLELVLVRIFSVTLWYHFAFMAISIALLGMGMGGIYVYLIAPPSSPEKTLRRLTVSGLAFSVTIVIALVIQLHTRFVPSFSVKSIFLLARVYLVIAIPFFFAGFCISSALTEFSRYVSKLYFADLVGAGLGCFLVIPVLSFVSGPNAIVVAAVTAAVAASIFAFAARWRPMQYVSMTLCGALVALLLVSAKANILRIKFIKGGNEEKGIVLERWNPFSRVVVFDIPDEKPFKGWGPSRAFFGPYPSAKMICIDAHASTPVYKFENDFDYVRALEYDSSAVAYHLKRGSGRALIIGPGGGKDVLTALLHGVKRVDGVEINPSVVEMVKEDYADYSGNLYDREDVNIVVDEGRSYIARSSERFDIIQASQVDSWAATAAGAFVLAENNLYTLEAFQQYFKHLSDDGILTMTRFFFDFGGGQTLRLAALGYEAWKASGIEEPEKHIVVIRNRNMGTVLLKKSEFTDEELEALEDLCQRLNYEIVAGPKSENHPVIQALYESRGSKSFYRALPFNMEPPIDDKPFFFHMLRLKDFFRARENPSGLAFNDNAIFILGNLLLIVSVLAVLFILGPLWTFKREALRQSTGKVPLLLYFTSLGIGFMMVEVPLMQKLMLFLGHPIYALSVTLFGLLIFSGIGSFLTSRIDAEAQNRWLKTVLLLLSALILTYIVTLPHFIHGLISIPTYFKIPLVVLGMVPLGLLMGMPFPMGIKMVDKKAHDMIPWVWGINGATSVFASVFAIVVAITWGFSAAMAMGLAAYSAALLIVHTSLAKN